MRTAKKIVLPPRKGRYGWKSSEGMLGPRRDDPVRTIRDPVELDGIP